MRWVIRLTRPLAWIVTSLVGAWLKLQRIAPDEKYRVTERDIRSLIKEGTLRGGLDHREQAIVNRALDLSDIRASSVMTSVSGLAVVDAAKGLQAADRVIRESGHSFIPVVDNGFSNVLGILRARDWLVLEKPTLKEMRKLLSTPVFVGENEPLLNVLEALRPAETRSVFVRNHGGNIVGMITLNDAVSHVLGPMRPLQT